MVKSKNKVGRVRGGMRLKVGRIRGGAKLFDLSHKFKLAYVSSTIYKSKVMSTYNHKTKIEVTWD